MNPRARLCMSRYTEHPTHCHSDCNNNFVTVTSFQNIFVKLPKRGTFEIFVFDSLVHIVGILLLN